VGRGRAGLLSGMPHRRGSSSAQAAAEAPLACNSFSCAKLGIRFLRIDQLTAVQLRHVPSVGGVMPRTGPPCATWFFT
jgi:hypothetical protein